LTGTTTTFEPAYEVRYEDDMAKPELGTKRHCSSCASKFFDLNKDPIVCPKCEAVLVPPQPDPVRSRRPSDRQPLAAHDATMPGVPNVIASPDGSKADNESAPTGEVEEVGGDLLLMDDQDEKLDATEVLGADIEKDDSQ
jgi:uncharacterized protein (TIGR02300 family)